MSFPKAVQKAVHEYVDMPAHIEDFAARAVYDLHVGIAIDADGDEHFSFTDTVDTLREYIEKHVPRALYVDEDGYVSESELEGEWLDVDTYEPCDPDEATAFYREPPECYKLESRDIQRILFGELEEYLR